MTPAQLSTVYTPFKRFAIFGAVQRVLHMARPALVDLVLHAQPGTPHDNPSERG